MGRFLCRGKKQSKQTKKNEDIYLYTDEMNNRIHVTLTHIYNATFEKTIWNKTAYSPPKKNKKNKKPNTTNNNQFLASSLLPPPSCCQTEKNISFFSSHGNFCTERKLRCEPLCIPKDFRMNSVCRCGIVTGPGAWEQFRYS